MLVMKNLKFFCCEVLTNGSVWFMITIQRLLKTKLED